MEDRGGLLVLVSLLLVLAPHAQEGAQSYSLARAQTTKQSLGKHSEMAAPFNTVPAAATGPCPTNADIGVLTYVEEAVVGAATLLQQAPVVGDVCATFLSMNWSPQPGANKGDLCDVVIKGVLDKRSDRSGLL